MNLPAILSDHAETILDEAMQSIRRARLKHYRAQDDAVLCLSLTRLVEMTIDAASTKQARPVIEHAETLALERYEAGYDLHEVQTAFNVLEEAIWKHVQQATEPDELAEALGLVGTVLGMAKDALARKWVDLASRGHSPSLDTRAIFAGTDGV